MNTFVVTTQYGSFKKIYILNLNLYLKLVKLNKKAWVYVYSNNRLNECVTTLAES